MPVVNCCRYCTERAIGCHAICEKYKAQLEKYRRQQAEIDALKRKDKDARAPTKHDRRRKK